ncbi:hypothetical protein E2493_01760 [Sphingomonas parva]|uniref:Uncharacterized protein n=1 Tax=Sphingomonas parva TaxID=2555898 RepID=A0A4Y8ZVF0_9SPHN|nr:hypothetical protein [Sphingomonas parva]TFI60001.1 hypothetical protein E2493_01760 [Sphingomonas parva]
MTERVEDRSEAAVVRSELVALQAVLIALCRRLAQDSPDLAPTVCRAFDDAEAILTGVAMKMGLGDPNGSAVAALRVVEEIRAGAIADERACSRPDDDLGKPDRRSGRK